jgi:CheY-like chemotaxis protein
VEIWLRVASALDDTAAVSAPSSATAPRPGAQILVVEDDDFVLESMVESLQALGHRVAQAPHGEAGLRELERAQPDLIITDYLMPGMTGAELVRRARVLLPEVPMIIATGYADMKAIEEVIGDDMLLRKPFQLAELAAIVERALQKVGNETSADQALP